MVDWADITDAMLWSHLGDKFYMRGARPREIMELVTLGEECGLFETVIWAVIVEAMNDPANIAARCLAGDAGALSLVRDLSAEEHVQMVAAWVDQYQFALGGTCVG